MERNYIKIYGAAILFSVFVGFSFMGVKSIIGIGTTLEILTFRYNFAFLGMMIFILFKKSNISFKNKSIKQLGLTTLFYILFMLLQAIGLIFTTSIVSGIIFALVPIIAKVIASVFLGEKATGLQNIFVLISASALIFMIILNASEINTNIIGIILLLLSSTSMAISNVFMRYVRKDYKPVEISFAIAVTGFLFFNMATIILGLKNGNLYNYILLMKNPTFMISTGYLGIFCTLFTAFLVSYMLANMEAVKATMFGNLSTAISLIAGILILGEKLEIYHIICTVLIIFGVAGVSFFGKKSKIPERRVV